MVLYLPTWVSIKEDELSRLCSKVELCLWKYENNKFRDPQFIETSIPLKIPTRFIKGENEDTMKKSISEFVKHISLFYQDKLEKSKEDLKKKSSLKSKKKLEEKVGKYSDFLSTISEKIYLSKPIKKGNYEVYHLTLPFLKESLLARYLPKEFMVKSESYITNLKLQLDYPFTLLELNGSNLKVTGKRPKLDDLLRAPLAAYDTETHNWKTLHPEEELNSKSDEELKNIFFELSKKYPSTLDSRSFFFMGRKDLLTSIRKIVNKNKGEMFTTFVYSDIDTNTFEMFTTLNSGKNTLEIKVGDYKASFKVNLYFTQEEAKSAFADLFQKDNPLFIAGCNQFTFDNPKGMELGGSIFPIGVGGRSPKQISALPSDSSDGVPFKRQTPAIGRENIDMTQFAMNFSSFLHSKRLDILVQEILGIDCPKDLTHLELFSKTSSAIGGDKLAAEEILLYAGADGLKENLLAKKLLLENILYSRVFASPISRINSTSPKTLTDSYWTSWFWRTKNTYPRIPIQKVSINLPQEIRNKYKLKSSILSFEDFDISAMKESILKDILSLKTGFFEGSVISLNSIPLIFSKMLRRDKVIDALYFTSEKSSDENQKQRIFNLLETICEYPLFLLMSGDEKRFSTEFELGFSGKEIPYYLNMIDNSFKEIKNILHGQDVVNTSKHHLVIKENPTTSENIKNLLSSNLITFRGKGNIISGSKNRFAAKIKGHLNLWGIASPDSKKGWRCEYEKNFYKKFFNILLGDASRQVKTKLSINYLIEQAVLLSSGQVSGEEILLEREAKRPYTDFSFYSTSPYKEEMIKQRLRAGDIVRERHSIPYMRYKCFNLFYEDQLEFGPVIAEPNEILKMRKIDEDKQKYHRGTISTIVSWAFPQLRRKKKLMNKIYMGLGEKKDSDEIIEYLLK